MKRVLVFLILITLIGVLVPLITYAEEPIALDDFDNAEGYANAVIAQTIKELEEAALRSERDDLVTVKGELLQVIAGTVRKFASFDQTYELVLKDKNGQRINIKTVPFDMFNDIQIYRNGNVFRAKTEAIGYPVTIKGLIKIENNKYIYSRLWTLIGTVTNNRRYLELVTYLKDIEGDDSFDIPSNIKIKGIPQDILKLIKKKEEIHIRVVKTEEISGYYDFLYFVDDEYTNNKLQTLGNLAMSKKQEQLEKQAQEQEELNRQEELRRKEAAEKEILRKQKEAAKVELRQIEAAREAAGGEKSGLKFHTGRLDLYTFKNSIVVGERGPIVKNVSDDYMYFLRLDREETPDGEFYRIVTVFYDENGFISFKDKEFEKGIKKKISDLKSGKVEAKNLEEILIKLEASSDVKYLSNPPIDGPSNKNQYFGWAGTLSFKRGDLYVVWDSGLDVWGNSYYGGFAFKNIKKKFKDMQVRSTVNVVGRYIGNTEIKLVSGQTATIPVLTDCYVQ